MDADQDIWQAFNPQVGDLLEITTSQLGLADGEGRAACLIEEMMRADDNGHLLRCRYLGASKKNAASFLGTHMSRRRRPIHLCSHEPCSQEGETLDYIHAHSARWFKPENFSFDYLKKWARDLMLELHKGKDGGGSGPKPRKKRVRRPRDHPKRGQESPWKGRMVPSQEERREKILGQQVSGQNSLN